MEEGKTLCEYAGSATKIVVREAISVYKKISAYVKKCCTSIGGMCCLCRAEKSVVNPSAPETDKKEERKNEISEQKNVTLSYRNARAKEVKFAADFTGWQPSAMRRKKDGTWHIAVKLTPGKYAYKFVVDDKWIKDPRNSNSRPDGLGSESSVLEII